MEQEYVLQRCSSFEPKHIFECGQCFRWNPEADGSYTGVLSNNVINVKKDKDKIIFIGTCEKDIKNTCCEYFDLNYDYEKMKEELSKTDEYLRESINYGYGIRILNQDLWETIISFIISANNNIPRIKGIIERISKEYGKEIVWNNKSYYTFPNPEELAIASVQDLRRLGLGFRDVRIYETTRMVMSREIDLNGLQKINDVNHLREKLLLIPGVGPKVADCIMLFALRKRDVFPIDVWVRRVMNELYIRNKDENKVDRREIEQLAKEKYGNFAGLAQQYLFYWKRETG